MVVLRGGGLFLMSEVPLYVHVRSAPTSSVGERGRDAERERVVGRDLCGERGQDHLPFRSRAHGLQGYLALEKHAGDSAGGRLLHIQGYLAHKKPPPAPGPP